MPNSSRGGKSGAKATASLAAANAAATIDLQGANGVVVWFDTAAALAGFTAVVEVQYTDTSPWTTGAFRKSDDVSDATKLAITATLTAVPAYSLLARTDGATKARVRCAAVTGGSINGNIRPVDL